MSDDCIAYRKINDVWKKTGLHCRCVSCSEARMERANDRACAMNVWDADGHSFYDTFPEEEYMGKRDG